MKKKWSSDKVKEVQRLLIERWPESFTQGPDLRPLSLEIHKELLSHRDEYPQLSGRVVNEVLNRHTRSFGYLYGVLKNEYRYNLENKQVDKVSPEHKEWARKALRAKQKLAQAVRKELKKKLQDEKRASRPVLKKVQTDLTNSPVIKYKPSRRRLMKPANESTVNLAS